MHPGLAVVQLLHSAATFSTQGGDPDLRGQDFAFIGDLQALRSPLPVVLNPDLPWKWITKKTAMVGSLKYYYANFSNAQKLWQPTDCMGEHDIALPRMIVLPPPFIV
jgi:hypothetical protein